jgi:glycosyltransferase involved in cell wall biosynthesis
MESQLIKNRDIIMFGLQPWDIEIGSNFKNMAVEIAKHNKVLYVNRPLDRISYLKYRHDIKIRARKQSFKKGQGMLNKLDENLWVLNPAVLLESVNWMPPGIIYKYLNKKNNKLLSSEIQQAITKLDFKNPILIIDNDFFNALYLKDFLKVECMVYYIRDYLSSQPYFSRHGKKAEPAIMAKADIVISNSLYLCNYAKKYNAKSFYIGQGCEVQNFINNNSVVPDDMKNIKKPIVGYCGNLTAARLNITLIGELALRNSNLNFVFVGPLDNAFKSSALSKMSNVYFLGSKPETDLPAYVKYFDVCINPQIVNQMTIGNYPRKIDEYLAAGKPVVATVTEAMQEFKNYAYLCNNVDEYTAALQKAILESNDKNKIKKRTEFAESHSWQVSVGKLYNAISNCK